MMRHDREETAPRRDLFFFVGSLILGFLISMVVCVVLAICMVFAIGMIAPGGEKNLGAGLIIAVIAFYTSVFLSTGGAYYLATLFERNGLVILTGMIGNLLALILALFWLFSMGSGSSY